MMIGIGIDICQICRIKKTVSFFGERFLTRIYTEAEKQYCFRRHNWNYQALAARFAAKEALYKALPAYFQPHIQWLDIQVDRLPGGQPALQFSSPIQTLVDQNQWKIWLSLTHEKDYALAVVAIEKPGHCSAV